MKMKSALFLLKGARVHLSPPGGATGQTSFFFRPFFVSFCFCYHLKYLITTERWTWKLDLDGLTSTRNGLSWSRHSILVEDLCQLNLVSGPLFLNNEYI